MDQNPYARFIKALDREKEDLDSIATVVSLEPFKIKVGDLEVDRDNILINPSLLDRDVLISTYVNSDIDLKKHKATIHSDLKVNDEVFIVRNGQIFIVVCKVVNI